jgi:hypothetical protein
MLHRPLYRFLGRFLKKNDRRQLGGKILLQDSFDYSIRNATLVNSRSILFACDIHPSNPQSSEPGIVYLDTIPSELSKLNGPASIYVPSDGLRYFAANILPKLVTPFVLVSGDSDLPINASTLGSDLEMMLSSPLLMAWYAQNRDYDHPNLHSLPIGINIHNLWANPLNWGGGFILPAMQELQLKTIAENAQPLSGRIPKIFCNWHFSIDRADRRDCLHQIDHSVCHFQENPLPVDQTWDLQSKYQFVLSPHGAGLDCHRTWEALLLGSIPIVKAAKLNDLFTDLPVVIVDDWTQINSNFLKNSVAQISSRPINAEKLIMRYWKTQISKALKT